MVIRKALFAMAASALVLGSSVANAAPADLRAGSAVGEAEGLGGGAGFGWIVALLIAAGVVGVILADNDEDESVSP